MEIKTAKVKDALTISKILEKSWKSTYIGLLPQDYLDQLKEDFWVKKYEDWICSGQFQVKILYDNELPVGCITFGACKDEKCPGFAEIASLYLLNDYINKGYGKALMETALKDLRSLGYKDVYLWVLRGNKRAENFYKKFGFLGNGDEAYFDFNETRVVDDRLVLKL